jgi:hypothetical protein
LLDLWSIPKRGTKVGVELVEASPQASLPGLDPKKILIAIGTDTTPFIGLYHRITTTDFIIGPSLETMANKEH